MAEYNLVFNTLLRGPSNLATYLQNLKGQVSSIKVPIEIETGKSGQEIDSIKKDLDNLSSSSRKASESITSGLSSSSKTVESFGNSIEQTTKKTKQFADTAATVSASVRNVATSTFPAKSSIDGLSDSTNRLSLELSNFLRKSSGATSAIDSFSIQAGVAARRFLAYAAVTTVLSTTVREFRSGVLAAIEFEREILKISQVGGDTKSQIDSVRQSIFDLSTAYGVSSKELVKSAVIFRQAGIASKDLKESLETLALAALAPNFSSMQEVTEGMIAIMAQFKTSTTETRDAIGSINAVAGTFAVEAGDLVEVVRRAGGAFAQAGGNVNELISIFTSVRSATRESAESISTGLRTIFTRLQRSETVDALKDLQINLRYTGEEAARLGDLGLTNQFVGVYEAINRISEGLSSIRTTDPRYSNILEQLGGYRQVSRTIPLIQNTAEAQKALNVAKAGSVSLDISAEKVQGSLAKQIDVTREKYAQLFDTIANSDAFQGVTSSLLSFSNVLADTLQLATYFIPVLTTIATAKALSFATNSSITKDFSSGFSGPKKFNDGGKVGGYGTKDTIPSMLAPEEYVINARAAKSIGYDTLDAINSGKIKKFQDGGSASGFRYNSSDFNKNFARYLKSRNFVPGQEIDDDFLKNLAATFLNQDLGNIALKGNKGQSFGVSGESVDDIVSDFYIRFVENKGGLYDKTRDVAKNISSGNIEGFVDEIGNKLYSSVFSGNIIRNRAIDLQRRGTTNSGAKTVREGSSEYGGNLSDIENSSSSIENLSSVSEKFDARNSISGLLDSVRGGQKQETNTLADAILRQVAPDNPLVKLGYKTAGKDSIKAKPGEQYFELDAETRKQLLQETGLREQIEEIAKEKGFTLKNERSGLGFSLESSYVQQPLPPLPTKVEIGKTDKVGLGSLLKRKNSQKELPETLATGITEAVLPAISEEFVATKEDIKRVAEGLVKTVDLSGSSTKELQTIIKEADVNSARHAAAVREIALGASGPKLEKEIVYTTANEFYGPPRPPKFYEQTRSDFNQRLINGPGPIGQKLLGYTPEPEPFQYGTFYYNQRYNTLSQDINYKPERRINLFELLTKRINDSITKQSLGIGEEGITQEQRFKIADLERNKLLEEVGSKNAFILKSLYESSGAKFTSFANPNILVAAKEAATRDIDESLSTDIFDKDGNLFKEGRKVSVANDGTILGSTVFTDIARDKKISLTGEKLKTSSGKGLVSSTINKLNNIENIGNTTSTILTAGLISVPLAQAAVDSFTPDARSTVESGSFARRAQFTTGRAISGGLSYAAPLGYFGFAVGSATPAGPAGGAIGAGIGATVGIITGAINSISESAKELQSIKIDNSINDFIQELALFSKSNISTNVDSTRQKLKTLKEQLEERNISESTNILGFVNQNDYQQINKNSLRNTFGSQLPDITLSLSKEAQKIAKENPSSALKDLTESLKNGNNGLNFELIDIVASLRNVSIGQVLKETEEIISKTQKDIKNKRERDLSESFTQTNVNDFSSLSTILKQSYQEDNSRENIEGLFSGQIQNRKLNFGVKGIEDFSIDSGLEKSLGTIRNLFGRSEQGSRIYERGLEVSTARSSLTDAINYVIANNNTDIDVGSQVSNYLRQNSVGLSEGTLSQINSSFSKYNEDFGEFIEDAKSGSTNLADKILEPLINSVKNPALEIANTLSVFSDELSEDSISVVERFRQISSNLDEVTQKNFSSFRAGLQIDFDKSGKSGSLLDTLSLDDLSAPFIQRQRRLTGFNDGSEFNPSLIGKRLFETREQISQFENIRNEAESTGNLVALKQATDSLSLLKSSAIDLQDALKTLSDETQNSIITEKLSNIESEKQSSRSLAEKYLTGSSETIRNLNKGFSLTGIANKVGVDALSKSQRESLFDFLSSAGNLSLTNIEGSPRANDFLNNLLDKSNIAPIKLSDEKLVEEDILRNKFNQNLQAGVEARNILQDFSVSLNEESINFLDEKFNNFIEKFSILIETQASKFDEQQLSILTNKTSDLEKISNAKNFLGSFGDVESIVSNKDLFSSRAVLDKEIQNENEKNSKINKLNRKFISTREIPGRAGGQINDIPDVDSYKSFLKQNAEKYELSTADIDTYSDIYQTNKSKFNPFGFKSVDSVTQEYNKTLNEQLSKKFSSRLSDSNKAISNILPNKNLTSITSSLPEIQSSIEAIQGKSFENVDEQILLLREKERLLREGSQVQGFSGGGSVFEPRGTDTIPAMLTKGEFVVNAESTKHNMPILEAINSSKKPLFLANGGFAFSASSNPYGFAGLLRTRALASKYATDFINARKARGQSFTNKQERIKRNKIISDYIGNTIAFGEQSLFNQSSSYANDEDPLAAFGLGRADFGSQNRIALGQLDSLRFSNKAAIEEFSGVSNPYNYFLKRKIGGFQDGGLVPGTGNNDNLITKVTSGEFIINKDATRSIGTKALGALNNIRSPIYLANGGRVSGNDSSSSSGNSMVSALLQMSSSLTQTFNAFAGSATLLADSINKIPTSLTGNFTHNVNIVLNGGEVLSRITPEIREMVIKETKEQLAKVFKNNFPTINSPS